MAKKIQLSDFGVSREEIILANGSRLVVFHKPGAPVAIRVSFFSGSRFDPKGKEGLAHFVEHMISVGTEKFPTKDKLAGYIERYGGGFGAWTSPETLGIDLEVGLEADLPVAVEVLSQMLLHSLFDPKVVETERGAIAKEIGEKNSSPGGVLGKNYAKLFYQGTPLGQAVTGEVTTIDKVTRQDLVAHCHDRLISSRMVIVAAGEVRVGELKKLLDEKLILGKNPSESLVGEVLPIRHKESLALASMGGTTDQVRLALGWRTCPSNHPDMLVLDMLSEILGGGRVAVLTRKLRYEKGLVYSVSADSDGFSDTGAWAVWTSTGEKNVQEVLDVITGEIKRVKEGKLAQDDLDFVKDKITKSVRRQMQRAGDWLRVSYRELITPKDHWTIADFINGANMVTKEDLVRVANKYFKSDQWYLVAVGNVSEKDFKVNF